MQNVQGFSIAFLDVLDKLVRVERGRKWVDALFGTEVRIRW